MATSTSRNGKPGSDPDDVKDHLRAAGEAAAEAARARADQAREWAQETWTGLRERVEEQPFRSAAVALGVGVLAGFLIANLLRARR